MCIRDSLSIYLGTLVPIILCMVRYYKNMLSDEGYLTHTLPVNKSSILLSKIFVTLVMELLTIFVIIISLMIYSFESIPKIAESVLVFIQNFDPSYIGSVYGIIALVLVEVVCAAVFQVTQVAMCLTLGAMHNKSKLVMAFVYYIAINFAIQVFVGVVAAIITIIGLHIKEFHIGYAYLVLSFVILITLVGIGLTYFVNLLCLKKRLNLE